MQEEIDWYENNHNTHQAHILEEFDSEGDELMEINNNNNYEWLEHTHDEQRLKILTNFGFQDFMQLFQKVEGVCESKGKGRKRRKLSKKTQFMMLLVWLKHYPYWSKLGSDFGISETWCKDLTCDLIFRVGEILIQDQVYWISKEEQVNNGVDLEFFSDVVAITDCTVQHIWRPDDNDEQRSYYSGKHHKHVVKMQTINACDGILMSYYGPIPGSIHDIEVFRMSGEGYRFIYEPLLADKAYIGLEHELWLYRPNRKPRGGELTFEEKLTNLWMSSDRIVIEHYYGRMKNLWKAMSDRWRNERIDLYQQTFGLCGALTNFEIRSGHSLRDDN